MAWRLGRRRTTERSIISRRLSLHRCSLRSTPYLNSTTSLSGKGTVSTMSLEPPTYLSSLQNNIRARPIPWEGAVRAGNITDDHLKKIKAVDKVRKEQRRQTVDGDLRGYVNLLSGGGDGKSVLDSASKRTDIVQYILVLAVDLINGMVIEVMNCLIIMEDKY